MVDKIKRYLYIIKWLFFPICLFNLDFKTIKIILTKVSFGTPTYLKVHSHLNAKSMLSENISGILGGTQC